jgi:hypothetical protein
MFSVVKVVSPYYSRFLKKLSGKIRVCPHLLNLISISIIHNHC